MFEPNREELAWAAGFFDGEGHVSFNHRKNTRSKGGLRFTVAQADRAVLDRMQRALGIGRVKGPYGPYKTQTKPFWIYMVGSFEEVQAAIAMMWSFLSPVKRAQAKVALQEAAISHAVPNRKTGPKPKGRVVCE